jgi:hypothetical protein
LTAVEQDWPFLLTLLPSGWEAWARETAAFVRPRGVPSVAALLRLVFAYAYCGLSLRNVVFWAERAEVADLSEVALRQRLRRAAPWLGRLLAEKLAQNARLARLWPAGLRVRLVDATSLSRPGSTGTDWKLHLGFDLTTLTLDQVAVTDATGGETFKRLPAQPGEITLGDRGYAQRQGIAAVVAAGGDVVVRLNWLTVPLQQPDGTPFDLFACLETLPAGQSGAWEVRTAPADGTPAVSGRLIALRKSPEAAETARRKVQQEARRKGKTPTARTLQAAAYVLLFTTLSEARLTALQVLELYRFRWQSELAFKRLKSLLALDELPMKDPDLCRTYLLTKVLAALCIDELSHRWVDFSPWGYGSPAAGVPVAALPGPPGDAAPGSGGDADRGRLGRGGPAGPPGLARHAS